MGVLSRDFSLKEKVLLLILALILVALVYYQFVHKTVSNGMEGARIASENLDIELSTTSSQLTRLTRMQNEIDELNENTSLSVMESYNNSKNEMALLNDILSKADQYDIQFHNVTRDGNQIRRDFALSFTTSKYITSEEIINDLYNSPYRCLIKNIRIKSKNGDITDDMVIVDLTATFYETMVGGTPDAGLPEDSNSDSSVQLNEIDYDL